MNRRDFLMRAGLTSAGLSLLQSGYASAQDSEGSETDLSRAELFQLIERDALASSTDAQRSAELFALYGPFQFPNDTTFDVTSGTARNNVLFGVDISHHNSATFPLEALKRKNATFVYMKASQGTGYVDSQFRQFWDRAGRLGRGSEIHRGAYHFLSASSDAEQQARHFLRQLAGAGGLRPTDMPPVLDLEWDKASLQAPDRWGSKTPAQIINAAGTWLRIVEQETHRRPLLYTARAWWRERIRSEAQFSAFSQYPLWIADYSNSSRAVEQPKSINNSEWALWQFTATAKFSAGFPGNFDANIFRGDRQQFLSKFGVREF